MDRKLTGATTLDPNITFSVAKRDVTILPRLSFAGPEETPRTMAGEAWVATVVVALVDFVWKCCDMHWNVVPRLHGQPRSARESRYSHIQLPYVFHSSPGFLTFWRIWKI